MELTDALEKMQDLRHSNHDSIDFNFCLRMAESFHDELHDLYKAVKIMRMTAIVDDDFSEKLHIVDSKIRELQQAGIEEGFTDG